MIISPAGQMEKTLPNNVVMELIPNGADTAPWMHRVLVTMLVVSFLNSYFTMLCLYFFGPFILLFAIFFPFELLKLPRVSIYMVVSRPIRNGKYGQSVWGFSRFKMLNECYQSMKSA